MRARWRRGACTSCGWRARCGHVGVEAVGGPAGDAVGCLVEAADGRPASMVWSALLAEVGSNDALEKEYRCWLRMEYWLEWKLEMLWKHQMVIQDEVQMVHVLEQRLEQLMDHEVDHGDPVGSFDGEPVVVMLNELESVLEMVMVTRLEISGDSRWKIIKVQRYDLTMMPL